MKIEAQSKEKGRKWERIIKKESYKIELNTFLEWKKHPINHPEAIQGKKKNYLLFFIIFLFFEREN